jgi:uncharacterized protein YgiM (DUF1202 family)
MIRLTLILAAVIFAVLVIVPGEDAGTDEPIVADDSRPVRDGLDTSALRETEDGALVLITAEGEELSIDLVIEPSELTEEDANVNLPPAEASGAVEPTPAEDAPDDAEAASATDEESAEPPASADPGATVLQVTGDRVNFRAGPSTEDEILTALNQGERVELIERVADGWAHLRVVATGLEGYMSGDFLAPAN